MNQYDTCRIKVSEEIQSMWCDKDFQEIVINMITDEIFHNACENRESLIYYAKWLNEYEGE